MFALGVIIGVTTTLLVQVLIKFVLSKFDIKITVKEDVVTSEKQ